MSDPTLKDMLLTSLLKQSILNIGVSLPLGMEISFYRDDDDQNVCMQVVNPDGGNTIYRFLKSTPLPPTSAYKLLREQELEQVLRDLLITIDLHTDCMDGQINRAALDVYIDRAEKMLGFVTYPVAQGIPS